MPCICIINPYLYSQPSGTTPTDLQIGFGTSYASRYVPDRYYRYSQTAIIIGNSEISAVKGKKNTGISLYYRNWDSETINNQNIYLSHIVQNVFATNTRADYGGSNTTISDTTGCKTTFSYNITSDGFKKFDFDTDFTFNNGSLNLLISYENINGNYTFSYGGTNYTSTGSTGSTTAKWFSDSSMPSGSTTSNERTSNRPNVIIHYLA